MIERPEEDETSFAEWNKGVAQRCYYRYDGVGIVVLCRENVFPLDSNRVQGVVWEHKLYETLCRQFAISDNGPGPG